MKKLLLCMVMLALMLMEGGCKAHFHFPILLDGPNTSDQAMDVNVVVGPDGTKHFFWVDCATYDGNCDISYKRTYTGDRLLLIQNIYPELEETPFVPYYRFPDAAMASDETIYLVWHYRDHDGQYFDCWNHKHVDGYFHGASCNKLQDEGQYSPENSYPKVIAYDNVAFAVYEVAGGTNTLYYRQLNPLDASHGMVSPVAGVSSATPSLAVSSYLSGLETIYVLHVAWSSNGGNAESFTYFNDNYGTSGNMDNPHSSFTMGVRSDPVIVTTTGASKTVYVVYRDGLEGAPGYLKVMYCYLPDCPTAYAHDDGILVPSSNWWLVGAPDMGAKPDDSVLISFLGMNDTTRGTTSFQEVFYINYFAGNQNLIPTRVTVNNEKESSPRLAMTLPGVTIAWRINSDPGYFRDVYIINNGTNEIRKVFTSPVSVLGGYYDIATCGEYIGGIFIDRATSLNPLHSPWVSFNDYGGYLPVTLKP